MLRRKSQVLVRLLVLVPLLGVNSSARSKSLRGVKLAGLHPGEKLSRAYGRFGKRYVNQYLSSARSAVWVDPCTTQQLTVQFGLNGTIRRITVGPMPGKIEVICNNKAYSRTTRARFGTNRGLLVGDSCGRIQELYGTPISDTGGLRNRELQAMKYLSSDRTGELKLEIDCDTGNSQVERISLSDSTN